MTSVLVTDGELRAALAAVRSIGRQFGVHVAAPESASLAGRSRFATSCERVPSPLDAPDAFRAALADLVARRGIRVVLPVSDAACRATLEAPEAFAPALLAAPSREAYARLSHKGEVARLARDVGLPIPDGDEVASLDEALMLARQLGWPVILKPVLSVDTSAAGSFRKRGVARADDEIALRRFWEESVSPGAALVQAIVPGSGIGLFQLHWKGETRAAFAHRRVREKPPSGGVSVLSESVSVDAELLRRVERILDACSFSGVAMAELRSDGRTHWLMEFNARLWGSLQLALDAGVDFPTLLVEATLGLPARPLPTYAAGLRSRWLLGDVDHAIALARGASGADGRSGLAAALSVLLRPAGPRCRWENPRLDDPLPSLRELHVWLRRR